MDFTAGLFEVIAAEDHEGQQALRTATSVATKRVSEQFGQFLSSSESLESYLHRYDFVFDDLKNTVTAVAEEYGADPVHVLAGVEARFKKQPEQKTASTEHEARRPKLCPYHSEVVDISLADGSPRAGFDAMAQHAWGAQHCKGPEYEGSRCNFKREMTTQAFWDEKAEQAEQRRVEREELRQQQELQNQTELPEFGPDNDTPVEYDEADAELDAGPGGEVQTLEPVAEEPQAEVPMAMAASSDSDAPLARTADDAAYYERDSQPGYDAGPWGDQGQAEAWCPYCQGHGCEHCGFSGYADALNQLRPSEQTPTGGPEPGYHGYASIQKEAPGGQHSEAWGEGGSKRNRQYEHILENCRKEHPDYSEDRCKELAASTVNKTRSEHGETKSSVDDDCGCGNTKTADALKTVDVDSDGEGPVPKIDKSKWVPENLKAADPEMDGTPHPTRRKDPTEPIIPSNDSDRFEETDAVLEKQDVTQGSELSHSGQGGTFPKGNQVDPVTSAVDPRTNPVREILLDQDDGFPEETDILSAIRQAR